MADMVDVYSHNNYELSIIYNSRVGTYEGLSVLLNICIRGTSIEEVHSKFRELFKPDGELF